MAHRLAVARPLGQDFDDIAEELPAERKAVRFGAAAELMDPLVGDCGIDELPRPPRRSRSRSRREGERVDVDESRAIDHVERLLEILLRLTGETADDVGRQGRPVKRLMNQVQQMQELIARVLSVHPPQQAFGSALQRQVKMGNDLRQIAQCGQDIGCQKMPDSE